MALVDIPFPRSSMPGQRPGEGQGRLLNCFCEMDGQVPTWRPSAGLVSFADTGASGPRGMLPVESTLYVALEDEVVSVTSGGTVTLLTGGLTGTDYITMARNNNASAPDVVAVTELGAYAITSSDVSEIDTSSFVQPNSVSVLDGFLLFTIGDGRVFASDLNSLTVDSLSFATCEADPDGLIRGTASGQLWYGWGQSSCEVWQNVGTTPFPLTRVSVIPLGLIGAQAIAGFEQGWSLQQIFVAADGTVRRLIGYDPQIVSTKDVERAIQGVTDKSTLIATVYVSAGHPIWSLSCPAWTWEFNAATGFWHERASDDQPTWRGRKSAFFDGKWIVGDLLSTKLQRVSEAALDEDGEPLAMLLESGPTKQFPSRMQVPAAFFDWTVGQGSLLGREDIVDPQVGVSWSHDGGAHWSEPLHRSLGKIGEYGKQVRVNRLGLTTHHGMRFRLESSSPVYRTLRGGRVEVVQRG